MRSVIPIVLLSACAAQGGEDGGSDNLPGRGIAGWNQAGDGPVLSPATPGELGGPAILVSGDRVSVWYHQKNGDVFSIYRVDAAPPGNDAPFAFGDPTLVREGARDPSIIVDPAAPDALLMAFTADGALGLARGDGATFDDLDATLPTGVSPSLVAVDGQLILYMIADGALAASFEADPLVFDAPTPVLAPGVDCVDLAGEPAACWDAGPIVDAEVRVGQTANGRRIWRVFYAARQGTSGATSLGFAASYDGLTFSRYAFNPVLDGKNFTAPATARLGAAYHLLTEERLGTARSQIDHFISVPAAPGDSF